MKYWNISKIIVKCLIYLGIYLFIADPILLILFLVTRIAFLYYIMPDNILKLVGFNYWYFYPYVFIFYNIAFYFIMIKTNNKSEIKWLYKFIPFGLFWLIVILFTNYIYNGALNGP